MNIILIILASLSAALIAVFPSAALEAAREALFTCGNIIIPSLFPYFVCANILIALGISRYLPKLFGKLMKPLFNVSGTGALALILGLVSGYPCGAATACSLYKEGSLSKNEAQRLIAFANNSGPLFIISAVGIGIYNSPKVGMILYASHIAGAIMTGIALRFFGESGNVYQNVNARKTSVFSAVSDSVTSILTLCGYVVFFAVILALLKKTGVITVFSGALRLLGISGEDSRFIAMGIFEITSALTTAKTYGLPYVSLILSLGGVSVLLQTYSFVRKCRLSIKPYIFGRLLAGGFSALTTKIILFISPAALPAAAMLSRRKTGFYISYLGSFLLAVFIFLVFVFLRKRRSS